MIYKAKAHDYSVLETFYFITFQFQEIWNFFFLSRSQSCDSPQFTRLFCLLLCGCLTQLPSARGQPIPRTFGSLSFSRRGSPMSGKFSVRPQREHLKRSSPGISKWPFVGRALASRIFKRWFWKRRPPANFLLTESYSAWPRATLYFKTKTSSRRLLPAGRWDERFSEERLQ